MWRPASVAFLGVYLVSTIAFFPQSQVAMILAVVGGLAGVGFAIASALRPNAMNAAALVGFLLGLSAFVVTENRFIDGNRGSVGVFMLACAVAPRPRRLAPGESAH
jgi:hypothetical protein